MSPDSKRVRRCKACGTEFPMESRFCSKCGAPAAATRLPLRGNRGVWRVEGKIDTLPSGHLYAARSAEDGTPVWVRTLPGRFATDALAARRFEAEAEALRELRHPGVLALLDHGRTERAAAFIVSEAAEGRRLDSPLAESGPLAAAEVVALGKAMLDVLQTAHERGLMHMDLHPGMVFLGGSSSSLLRVAEIGIARLLEPRERQAPAAYAAPERLLGYEEDARSDVYAVAAMLYELLTGEPPYGRGGPSEVSSAQIAAPPQLPSERRPGEVPTGVDRVLIRALRRDPEHRFGSCESFAVGLEAALTARVSSTAMPAVSVPAAPAPDLVPEGAGDGGESGERVAARGPMLGRDDELRSLWDVLQGARKNEGAARMVIAEPGMGKTRLLDELAKLARSREWRVTRASGGRFAASGPMELVRQLVLGLCADLADGERDDSPEQALDRLERVFLAEEEIQRLKHLFGDAPASRGFTEPEDRLLDRSAMFRAFLQATAEWGLLLIIDDAQEADGPSLHFLEQLLDYGKTARMVVVAAARKDKEAGLFPGVERFELGPLPEDALLALARAQIDGAVLPPPIEALLRERAGGNPLFAVELIHRAIEAGELVRKGARWHSSPSLKTDELPDSLALLLGARLGALSPTARRIARHAAVVGRSFAPELVLAALGAGEETPPDPTTLRAALDECTSRGLIEPALETEGIWRFAQPVMRDAVLRTLRDMDRRQIHLRLATALERGAHAALADPAEAIATHYLAGGMPGQAAEHLITSAQRMESRRAFAEAAERYLYALEALLEQARELAGIVNAVNDHAITKVMTVATRAAHCTAEGDPEGAAALVDRVLEQVPAHGDAFVRAELLRQQAEALLRAGRATEAQAPLIRALACLSAQPRPDAIARVRATLSRVFQERGDARGAMAQLEQGLRALHAQPPAPDARGRDQLWQLLLHSGDLHWQMQADDRAKESFAGARAEAQRVASAIGEARALERLAAMAVGEGRFDDGIVRLKEALERAVLSGDGTGRARLQHALGRVHQRAGRPREALASLQAALAAAQAIGWQDEEASVRESIRRLQHTLSTQTGAPST